MVITVKDGFIKILKNFSLILLLNLISINFLANQTVLASNQIKMGNVEDVFEVSGPKTIEVILETIYLDGEVSEEIVEETIWSMEDFWSEYEGWTLVNLDDSQIIFQQTINDISPFLKLNGYFGLSEEGILSIFNGKPSDENVIQSFFHIQTDKLESHQHVQLKQGIPVLTREKYEEVIKTFKQYERKI